MRQDLMYVNPNDFDKAFEFFRYCFDLWTQGYKKWGTENYSATFVKDGTVPAGMIMFCPHGERENAVVIEIGEPPKQKLPKLEIEG